MYRVSSLGRPIDPRFSSNLVAVFGSALAGLFVGIYNLSAATPLGTSPVVAAVGVFIAWAIGRELDPDRSASAVLAMPVSFVALLVAPAELMLGTGVLIATRAISGTVGAPLRNVDLLTFLGLAGLLGAGGITVVALPGLVLAATIGADERKKAGGLVVGMLAVAAASAALARPELGWEPAGLAEWTMIGLVAIASITWPKLITIAAPADLGGSLTARRITISRWTAVATVLLGFLVGGGIGIGAAFSTAGAAVVATAAVGLVHRRHGSSLIEERV